MPYSDSKREKILQEVVNQAKVEIELRLKNNNEEKSLHLPYFQPVKGNMI